MNRLFLFLALVLLRIGGYAQCTLPSSYKPRSEFPDNESFLRYNFEEHKEDYIRKELGLLYMAYGKGIEIKDLTMLSTTPWMEEDNQAYVEGVTIEYQSLDDVLRGEEYVSIHVYVVAMNILDIDFWNEMPEVNLIENFIDRTRKWQIRDIKVLQLQQPSM